MKQDNILVMCGWLLFLLGIALLIYNINLDASIYDVFFTFPSLALFLWFISAGCIGLACFLTLTYTKEDDKSKYISEMEFTQCCIDYHERNYPKEKLGFDIKRLIYENGLRPFLWVLKYKGKVYVSSAKRNKLKIIELQPNIIIDSS